MDFQSLMQTPQQSNPFASLINSYKNGEGNQDLFKNIGGQFLSQSMGGNPLMGILGNSFGIPVQNQQSVDLSGTMGSDPQQLYNIVNMLRGL